MKRDDFRILVNSVAIKGTMLTPAGGEGGARGCIVLCHGIPAGTQRSSDPGYAHLAETLVKDGFSVAFFNFRGAGDSGGDFDIRGWVDDLRGVLGLSRQKVRKPPILFGFSAGGAVAVCVAKNDPGISGLILCGSPAEFSRVVGEEGPEGFLAHARTIGIIRHTDFPLDHQAWANGFREVCAEANIRACGQIPKLIIHGDADEIVPVEHGYRLYEAAPEPKQLSIIRGGGHRLRLNDEAMRTARDWLAGKRG